LLGVFALPDLDPRVAYKVQRSHDQHSRHAVDVGTGAASDDNATVVNYTIRWDTALARMSKPGALFAGAPQKAKGWCFTYE
jgi:hypothetical protein